MKGMILNDMNNMYNKEINDILELFEDVDKSCSLCDDSGKILWCNSFAKQGQVPLCKGTLISQFFKNDAEQYTLCKKIIMTQGTANGEIKYISGLFEFKAKGIKDGDNCYSFWIFTPKVLANQSRRSKLNAKYMSNISSNLMNSVFNIFNALEPVSATLERTACFEETAYLNVISKDCFNLFKTTTNVDEYVKSFDDNNSFYPTLISLKTELMEFVAQLSRLLSPSELQVVLTTEDDDNKCFVNADVYKLYLAILNVLNNSFRHALESIPIKINLCSDDDFAIITIIDEGDGIESEVLEHVFEPFYSMSSITNMPEGLGLGLYVTKAIIEKHDGSVSIESTEYVGTTVTIKLPLAEVSQNGIYLGSSKITYDIMGGGQLSMLNSFLPSDCFNEYY